MKKKDIVIKEALELSLAERAEIIEWLINSLVQQDDKLDEMWKIEVEKRIKEYEHSSGSVLTLEEVFSRYQNVLK